MIYQQSTITMDPNDVWLWAKNIADNYGCGWFTTSGLIPDIKSFDGEHRTYRGIYKVLMNHSHSVYIGGNGIYMIYDAKLLIIDISDLCLVSNLNQDDSRQVSRITHMRHSWIAPKLRSYLQEEFERFDCYVTLIPEI